MKKYALRSVIAIIMVAALLSSAFAARFSDVADRHWASAYISNCVDKSLIDGYPDKTFRPDGKLAVGEYIKLLSCIVAPETRSGAQAAASGSHWASPYFIALRSVIGDILPSFSTAAKESAYLSGEISRLEMAKFSAAVHSELVNGSAPVPKNIAAANALTDLAAVSEDERAYVAYCIENGIIDGFNDKTFRPADTLTRAQAAKVTDLISDDAAAARSAALEKDFGADAAKLAAALEKDYSITVTRGENVKDNADFAIALRAYSDYFAALPKTLVRNLGDTMTGYGGAYEINPKLPTAAELSGRTRASVLYEKFYSEAVFSLSYEFGVYTLSRILEAHYPDALAAYGLSEEDFHIYFKLFRRSATCASDGKITYSDWDSAKLYKSVSAGKASAQDKETLAKCELVYQIIAQILNIPKAELESIRFFPADHVFATTVDMSKYYKA